MLLWASIVQYFIIPGALVVVTYFVAHFTKRLKSATEEYTRVTKELLEQSRRTFESDVISGIMCSAAQLAGSTFTKSYSPGYIEGMIKALDEIDRSTSEKVIEGLGPWLKGDRGKKFDWMFTEELKRRIERKYGEKTKK